VPTAPRLEVLWELGADVIPVGVNPDGAGGLDIKSGLRIDQSRRLGAEDRGAHWPGLGIMP